MFLIYLSLLPCIIQVSSRFVFNEYWILGNFTSHIAEQECRHISGSAENILCQQGLNKKIRTVKMAAQYRRYEELNEHLSNKLGNWRDHAEGHSMGSYGKVELLQNYADNPAVNTICEIGFNLGYSTLNFLMANPTANIISFDLFEHDYTAFATRALHSMFPDRNVVVIAGDSGHTVNKFANIFPTQKCDLLFIDGGHATQHLINDLNSMKRIANVKNIVIVDDLQADHLMGVWNDYLSVGPEIVQHDIATVSSSPCLRWEFLPRSEDPSLSIEDQYPSYKFHLDDETCRNNYVGSEMDFEGVKNSAAMTDASVGVGYFVWY